MIVPVLIINKLTNNTLFPADLLWTHCQILSNVRRNSPQDHFSLKINTPFLITQTAEVALVTETFRHSATSATCCFRLFPIVVFFLKKVFACRR